MSGAIEVASRAPEIIETLLSEMLEGDYPDNWLALGSLISGDDTIQVQLKVTRNPSDFYDDELEAVVD